MFFQTVQQFVTGIPLLFVFCFSLNSKGLLSIGINNYIFLRFWYFTPCLWKNTGDRISLTTTHLFLSLTSSLSKHELNNISEDTGLYLNVPTFPYAFFIFKTVTIQQRCFVCGCSNTTILSLVGLLSLCSQDWGQGCAPPQRWVPSAAALVGTSKPDSLLNQASQAKGQLR